MAFNQRVKNAQNATAATGLAGAAPQTGNGSSVLMQKVLPGTLSARIAMTVKTSSLTQTPSWQVSDDNGSTWVGVKDINNPAQVATAAGTGSTVVTTIDLVGPASLSGHRLVRAIVTTAGATAVVTDDFYAISYSWLETDFN